MTNRTRSLALVTATLTTLLAWSGATAVAQSDPPLDPSGASYWTGTWSFIEGSFTPPREEAAGPGYDEVLGIGRSADVAADDPRITGTMTQVQNARLSPSLDPDDGHIFIINGTARIDNPDGAWVGTWTSYGADRVGGGEWYVLEGEGAYEGLTAVFWGEVDPDIAQGSPIEGVILSAALPALPDPAPPAG